MSAHDAPHRRARPARRNRAGRRHPAWSEAQRPSRRAFARGRSWPRCSPSRRRRSTRCARSTWPRPLGCGSRSRGRALRGDPRRQRGRALAIGLAGALPRPPRSSCSSCRAARLARRASCRPPTSALRPATEAAPARDAAARASSSARSAGSPIPTGGRATAGGRPGHGSTECGGRRVVTVFYANRPWPPSRLRDRGRQDARRARGHARSRTAPASRSARCRAGRGRCDLGAGRPHVHPRLVARVRGNDGEAGCVRAPAASAPLLDRAALGIEGGSGPTSGLGCAHTAPLMQKGPAQRRALRKTPAEDRLATSSRSCRACHRRHRRCPCPGPRRRSPRWSGCSWRLTRRSAAPTGSPWPGR